MVVSPHLDDGVLSLGATIAEWTRAGAAVALLTVLGCDPESEAPAGGWDTRGGFGTEGESARVRREEDRGACEEVGATPFWLPFGSGDYERHGDEHDVLRAVAAVVEGAGLVVVPGSPLSHPDHAWLARIFVSEGLGAARLALYAEQPYTWRSGTAPRLPEWAARGRREFGHGRTRLRDRLAKRRAISHYRSQLPLLAMHGSLRRGPLGQALAPEWVAWSDG